MKHVWLRWVLRLKSCWVDKWFETADTKSAAWCSEEEESQCLFIWKSAWKWVRRSAEITAKLFEVLSLYIYICPYREEKKREKENTDLIFFFFSSGFVTRLSLSLFLEVFMGSGYSSLHSSAAWGVQKEPGLRYWSALRLAVLESTCASIYVLQVQTKSLCKANASKIRGYTAAVWTHGTFAITSVREVLYSTGLRNLSRDVVSFPANS